MPRLYIISGLPPCFTDEFSALKQELLETNEAWHPEPDEWFSVTVNHINLQKRIIVMDLSNGEQIRCTSKDVSLSPGQHTLCLPTGTEGAVRLTEGPNGLRVTEAAFDGEPPNKTEPVRITHWRGSYGSADRECIGRCPLFCVLPHRSVLSQTDIKIGDVCTVDIVQSEREGRGFVGIIKSKVVEK